MIPILTLLYVITGINWGLVLAAFDALQEKPQIDPKQIYIFITLFALLWLPFMPIMFVLSIYHRWRR